jgi:hypothetical protein
MRLEFSRQIFKKSCEILMIIRPGGAELFLADRQTDVTQLIVSVRNFANAPVTGAPITPRVSVLSVLACKNSLIMGAKAKFKGHIGLLLCYEANRRVVIGSYRGCESVKM